MRPIREIGHRDELSRPVITANVKLRHSADWLFSRATGLQAAILPIHPFHLAEQVGQIAGPVTAMPITAMTLVKEVPC